MEPTQATVALVLCAIDGSNNDECCGGTCAHCAWVQDAGTFVAALAEAGYAIVPHRTRKARNAPGQIGRNRR